MRFPEDTKFFTCSLDNSFVLAIVGEISHGGVGQVYISTNEGTHYRELFVGNRLGKTENALRVMIIDPQDDDNFFTGYMREGDAVAYDGRVMWQSPEPPHRDYAVDYLSESLKQQAYATGVNW